MTELQCQRVYVRGRSKDKLSRRRGMLLAKAVSFSGGQISIHGDFQDLTRHIS